MKKAKRLHPDKGGDQQRFQELRSAYESLRDVMTDDVANGTGQDSVWEDLEKWVDWAGRWGKRLFRGDTPAGKGITQAPEILRIRVPWKLLEDRTQSVRIEYDGWPVCVPLGGTETIGAIGLRIRLVPQAEYKTTDESGNEVIHKLTDDDPWMTDACWLFDVPSCATEFRVCGGEWTDASGDYGRGVSWRHAS